MGQLIQQSFSNDFIRIEILHWRPSGDQNHNCLLYKSIYIYIYINVILNFIINYICFMNFQTKPNIHEESVAGPNVKPDSSLEGAYSVLTTRLPPC